MKRLFRVLGFITLKLWARFPNRLTDAITVWVVRAYFRYYATI